MRARSAAAGSAIFLALAPGTVVGLVPWLLTGWEIGIRYAAFVRLLGLTIVAASAAVLALTFVRFAREGRGTPSPVAPTEQLVVGGLYRHVRNPMYLAVIAAIAGQALVLGQGILWLYGALVAVAVVGFVKLYEEPVLTARYGDGYRRYRREVPGWWPRRRT